MIWIIFRPLYLKAMACLLAAWHVRGPVAASCAAEQRGALSAQHPHNCSGRLVIAPTAWGRDGLHTVSGRACCCHVNSFRCWPAGHATGDTFVKPAHSQKLFEATGTEKPDKTLEMFPGDHNSGRSRDFYTKASTQALAWTPLSDYTGSAVGSCQLYLTCRPSALQGMPDHACCTA